MDIGLLDRLTTLPSGWVYTAVGALVFAEDALLVGLVVPGETAAILGGVTASMHHTGLVEMMLVVVASAILGDFAGYHIGNRYGDRLLGIRPLARRRERLDRAREFLARRGGPGVFLGRFVAFLRTVVPFLAGASHMRYQVFLAYNAVGGVVWGVGSVLLGYLVGFSYQRIASTFGEAAALVVLAVVLTVVIVMWVRRRRAGR